MKWKDAIRRHAAWTPLQNLSACCSTDGVSNRLGTTAHSSKRSHPRRNLPTGRKYAKGRRKQFHLRWMIIFVSAKSQVQITRRLYFAGHGWIVKSKGVDAYKGVDVKGKIVVVYGQVVLAATTSRAFRRGVTQDRSTGTAEPISLIRSLTHATTGQRGDHYRVAAASNRLAANKEYSCLAATLSRKATARPQPVLTCLC